MWDKKIDNHVIWKHNNSLYGVILKRYFVYFSLIFLLFFHGAYSPVFAEIDPIKLNEILSKLSGKNVDIPISLTGSNSGSPNSASTGSSLAETGTVSSSGNEVSNPEESETIPVVENVVDVKPSFKILKVETGDKKATFTFKVLDETSAIRKFEFLYADVDGNSNKVLTFDKESIKNPKGEYVWYIENLSLTKYTISIAWVGADGENIPGVISQPFIADLSLSSAGKCIIPNVSGLRVLEKKDTSVLYWDSIPEAIQYKIYKKDAQGAYVFIQETKDDSYTVYVSDGSVKYEDFSIKAVCSDGTESMDFAPSTSVRTGPSELILLGLISALIGFIIIRKRKQNFWKI